VASVSVGCSGRRSRPVVAPSPCQPLPQPNGYFAAGAFLLAVIGLFGVVSFTVQERVLELGVRLAFGATPHRIVQFVMRDARIVVVIGAVIGCISALLPSRFLSSMLFAAAGRPVRGYSIQL